MVIVTAQWPRREVVAMVPVVEADILVAVTLRRVEVTVLVDRHHRVSAAEEATRQKAGAVMPAEEEAGISWELWRQVAWEQQVQQQRLWMIRLDDISSNHHHHLNILHAVTKCHRNATIQTVAL